MTKPKLTPWFPPSVKPARDGVYVVRISGDEKYSRWQGNQWHRALSLFEVSAHSPHRSTDCYSVRFDGWRGLAKEPK